MNNHSACTVRYGITTIHGGSRHGQSWSFVAKPWMPYTIRGES